MQRSGISIEMVRIKIKSSALDELENFYINVLGFTESNDGLRFPSFSMDSDVVINILHDRSGTNASSESKNIIYFSYSIGANFLSYCQSLMEKGVNFEVIGATPGGYAARGADPEGNIFEIECESFEDDDKSINPENWPSYRRY